MSGRFADWESRLAAVIGAAELRPHRFGVHDCCLFAAACIRAQTGADPARGLRGKYRSAAGAARQMAALGFTDVLTLADGLIGARVPVLMAARGDIVSDGQNLGVMWAPDALFVGQEGTRAGLISLARRHLVAAWRVAGEG